MQSRDIDFSENGKRREGIKFFRGFSYDQTPEIGFKCVDHGDNAGDGVVGRTNERK